MALNSIHKLRLSPAQEQALREWIEAKERYSSESKIFQRVRRQLPKKLGECTPAQVMLLYTAKNRYKEACKEFYEAQTRYNSSSSLLNGPLDTQDKIADAIAQLVSVIKGTPSAAVLDAGEATEQAALEARFGSIEQNPMLSAIAQVARERQQKHDAPQLQKLLDLTDEIMDMDTPADAQVATQVEQPTATTASTAEDAAEQPEPDTPEALIQKYGIPEAPR